MTLADLRKRVMIDKLDDEDYEPEIIDNFLNDAQRDIFNQFELPFMEKIFIGDVPAGASIIKLPDDVSRVEMHAMTGVQNFFQMKLEYRDFFMRFADAMNNTPHAPNYWTEYAGNILLDAPTDKEYKLYTYYYKTPNTMAQDTDKPDIPEEFTELLILGALRRVHDRNEDMDLSTQVENQYQAQLQEMVTRFGMRDAFGPIKMRNLQI